VRSLGPRCEWRIGDLQPARIAVHIDQRRAERVEGPPQDAELDPVDVVERAAPGGEVLRPDRYGLDQVMDRQLAGPVGADGDADIVAVVREQQRQQRQHRVAGLVVVFLPAVGQVENGLLHLS
jgi:hypothetical protein